MDFSAQIAVPNVATSAELAAIMKDSNVFSDHDIQRAISEVRDSTSSDRINVGVAGILTAIQTAKQDEDVTARFAEIVGEMCAENSAAYS